MKNSDFTMRSMTRDEADIAVEWAAREGWNPGLSDAECYYGVDPEGFFIGLLDEEPIGCISAVKYGESFGFVGFYIVKPQYRGRGFGLQLWNTGMEYLHHRNIGLDGVLAQQENYKKSGFKLAYSNIRFEGSGGGSPPQISGVTDLQHIPFQEVAEYDKAFFPEQRTTFIKSWINQPGCHSLGIHKEGRLRGYGVIRPCRQGYKIGPLYADGANLAQTLFQALKVKVPSSSPVFLDVPEVNTAAVMLASQNSMKKAFETARMYTQESADISVNRTYGVTSFEIG